MVQENLRSFTMNGIQAGLLMTCLLVFAIGFMGYNNPTGLGDTGEILDTSYTASSSYLYEVDTDANTLLNISSNTNPEVSDLGSRDGVASSFSATGSGKGSWESAKALMSWVFTGTTGQLLMSVIGGMIGILAFFLITKNIRQGD